MHSHDCPRVFYLEGIVPLLPLFKLLQLGHLVHVVRQLYKAFVFPHTLGLQNLLDGHASVHLDDFRHSEYRWQWLCLVRLLLFDLISQLLSRLISLQ